MKTNTTTGSVTEVEAWENVAISILRDSVLTPFHAVQRSIARWGTHK